MTLDGQIIKKGQIWQHKISGKQFLITTKDGIRWKAKELGPRQGKYLSTHSFLPFILRQKFELL